MLTCKITTTDIKRYDYEDPTGINNPLVSAVFREVFPTAKTIVLSRVPNIGYRLTVDGKQWFPTGKTETWLDRWFAGIPVKTIQAGIRDFDLPEDLL